MQNRFILFGLMVLGSLALIGLIWVLVIAPPPVESEPAEPLAVAPAVNPTYKDLEINETTDTYKISAKYPVFSTPFRAEMGNINSVISDNIIGQVSDFKREVSSATVSDPERKSTLEIGYEIMNLNPGFISVKIGNYGYLAEAAHGSGIFYSFNYDVKNDKLLKLSDLFKPDVKYLRFLSEESRPRLKEQMRDYYQEEFALVGTEPKEENYNIYNFTKNKLRITFNVYQVAPYASGPQSVDISYAEMKDILNP